MFKEGDVIRRKSEYYNDWWIQSCGDRCLPLDVDLVFVRINGNSGVVRWKWPDGKEYGCGIDRMELAVLTLENE